MINRSKVSLFIKALPKLDPVRAAQETGDLVPAETVSAYAELLLN